MNKKVQNYDNNFLSTLTTDKQISVVSMERSQNLEKFWGSYKNQFKSIVNNLKIA